MNITVVGSGYVGLVSGTCFAEMGNQVTCVDIDPKKIDKLKNGIIPIFEPGLEAMVNKNAQNKTLGFTTDLSEAIAKAKIVFIHQFIIGCIEHGNVKVHHRQFKRVDGNLLRTRFQGNFSHEKRNFLLW